MNWLHAPKLYLILSIALCCCLHLLFSFYRLQVIGLLLELPEKLIHSEEVWSKKDELIFFHVTFFMHVFFFFSTTHSATSTREYMVYSANFLRGNLWVHSVEYVSLSEENCSHSPSADFHIIYVSCFGEWLVEKLQILGLEVGTGNGSKRASCFWKETVWSRDVSPGDLCLCVYQ